MNYGFIIEVKCMNDSFSASALGEQGEWSRGLNIALENLLNKLLQKGIKSTIQPYEPDKEIPAYAERSDAPRELTSRTDETAASPKTRKTKLSP